ncbi:hypothetical protein P3X46_003306 [Hevea brasiliensis]|uniref:BHLH domain-containing protein n=1 Tax=Hevea brasiliensis TaxID=3981 RepID=A0ABQ9N6J7_HEVBR|nr:transcription factor UPBEAT1-like [Hevea brasiliensis]KAJ9187893.1 hypothetical protein P3X46_003306 [Hevea brasiliensis]
MGVSAHNLLASNLKGRVQDNEEMVPVLESQARRRWQIVRKQMVTRKKRSRRVLMNSRTRLEGSGSKAANGIHRRVRTLKKLIPNSEAEGLEGLFRDSADYILFLQMRVKVMQIMVKVFTGSDE